MIKRNWTLLGMGERSQRTAEAGTPTAKTAKERELAIIITIMVSNSGNYDYNKENNSKSN